MTKDIIELWHKNWGKLNVFNSEKDDLRPRFYLWHDVLEVNDYYPTEQVLYELLTCDVINRHKRLMKINSMYSLGIKHNLLYDKYLKIWFNLLKSLGICYEENKVVAFPTDEKLIKSIYFKLKENDLVKNEVQYLYYDKENNYYQKHEIDIIDNLPYLKSNPQLLKSKLQASFYLNSKQIIENIIHNDRRYEEIFTDNLITINGCVVNCLIDKTNLQIEIFLSNPEFIYGITFCVIKSNSKWLNIVIKEDEEEFVREFIQDDTTALGVFSGSYLIHPLTNKLLPIWISNYVEEEVHLGIPAIYSKDYEFAKELDLTIIPILKEKNMPSNEKGILINSDFLDGLNCFKAKHQIMLHLYNENIGISKTKTTIEPVLIYHENTFQDIFVHNVSFIGCMIKDQFSDINIDLETINLWQKNHLLITNQEKVFGNMLIYEVFNVLFKLNNSFQMKICPSKFDWNIETIIEYLNHFQCDCTRLMMLGYTYFSTIEKAKYFIEKMHQISMYVDNQNREINFLFDVLKQKINAFYNNYDLLPIIQLLDEYLDEIIEAKTIKHQEYLQVIKWANPFIPFTTEELYKKYYGYKPSLYLDEL